MTVSLSAVDIQIAQSPACYKLLDPKMLIEAGILSDPNTSGGAYKRARALVAQGAYQEARALLHPHARTSSAEHRPQIEELLALCTMHTGGAWEGLMRSALEAYGLSGRALEEARAHRHFAQLLIVMGRFAEAEQHLARASDLYDGASDIRGKALSESIRGHLEMRSGRIKVALHRVDQALLTLIPLGRSRAEGLVRLERARVLAHLCEAGATAKELIWAERMLANTSHSTDRIRTRLVRAETLLLLGDHARAAAGLRRLMIDVSDHENVSTRAWVGLLLGRSLSDHDTDGARRHLMRARHLFEKIGSRIGIASCDSVLARVEHLVGLSPEARLSMLESMKVEQWPQIDVEQKILRAELCAKDRAEDARTVLLDIRSHAKTESNRYLVRLVDDALARCRLLAANEIDGLAAIEGEPTAPIVQAGSVTISHAAIPPGGPQLMDEPARPHLSFVSSNSVHGFARLLGEISHASSAVKIAPPACRK